MATDLVTRLRITRDLFRSVEDPPLVVLEDAAILLDQAALSIEMLTTDLTASVQQRERMIDAMKEAQGKLRELQDFVITPKDDGL